MMYKQINRKKSIVVGTSIAMVGLFSVYGNIVNGQNRIMGKSIDSIVKNMTLEEKASFVIGTGMEGFDGSSAVVGETFGVVDGAAGTSYPLARFGIPSFVMTDGPAGVRISPTREKSPGTTFYATAFPVGIAIASSWNPNIAEEIGKAMGNEVLEYNCDVLLAPALNIQRNPLNGRNFEYYSEDPLVAGKIASGYVNGVQSNGVGTSIKHFVANNQETNRMSINEHISQRAMRELYLRGFEIVVKDAQPWTVMTSYNKVNGVYTSANKALLTDILRKEWGYKGTVMTDWFGGFSGFSKDATAHSSDVVAQLSAGNNLLMPGVSAQREAIITAVKNGKLKMAELDQNVQNILELIAITPKAKDYKFSDAPDLKAHAIIDRNAALEGMVLLKNNGNTLPLKTQKKLAAFGNTSYDFIAGGTGSGDVHRAYTISLIEGLSNASYTVDPTLESSYNTFVKKANADAEAHPIMLGGIMPLVLRPGEMNVDISSINNAAQEDDAAIITIGRQSGEFLDRKDTSGDFQLTDIEQSLIQNVSQSFHAKGKKVIVILNVGGVVETASWKNKVDAILLSWQVGQEGGNAVAEILKGNTNPSGKLAITFPNSYSDVPSSKQNEFGGIPIEDPKEVYYNDGVYVGYRYYSTFNKQVSYPFGYGLSYTKFQFSDIQLDKSSFEKELTVTIKVTNTGSVAGKEVAQLYLAAPKGKLDKPVHELKGFAKTELLAPGASQTLTFTLDPKSLASFDTDKSAWIADKGNYTVEIGNSSLIRPLKATFNLKNNLEVEKVHNVLEPDKKLDLIKP